MRYLLTVSMPSIADANVAEGSFFHHVSSQTHELKTVDHHLFQDLYLAYYDNITGYIFLK
jgi:hypothetical protein